MREKVGVYAKRNSHQGRAYLELRLRENDRDPGRDCLWHRLSVRWFPQTDHLTPPSTLRAGMAVQLLLHGAKWAERSLALIRCTACPLGQSFCWYTIRTLSYPAGESREPSIPVPRSLMAFRSTALMQR